MMIIILSTAIVGVLGLFIGIFLGAMSEVLKVEVDEKEVKIRECLPGNNCGGCGYPGCDGLAAAIAKGEAPANACPVGGNPVAEKISAILGVKLEKSAKKVAFVACKGDCTKITKAYNYTGVKDCKLASIVPNKGEKACQNACLGYGSCVKACKFDAIHVIDGVAVVDKEKCKACGACIKACPNNLIKLVDYDKKHIVTCSNTDKGPQVLKACSVSCIACGMCERTCTKGAIKVIDNIATMNEACTDCGDCAEKCPRKCIS
ncbi:MAG: RnfABCDGE type electron transport complex subunit B [Lachnospiraceae bacterium]|nr:RnfABCDGE type electron transport complex subunit B [Lachnospiraceae bacterium]